MGDLKKLAGQTAIYGIPTIVGRFLNYLLVPVYTYSLTADRYGVVSELYAYVSFLMIMLTYGMETAYFRFSQEAKDKKTVFNTSMLSLFTTTMLFLLLTMCNLGSLSDAMGYSAHKEYIALFLIIVSLDALRAIPYAKLRRENKAARFALIKSVDIFSNILFNLFFFFVLKPKDLVLCIFLSNMFASLIAMLMLLPEYLQFRFKFDFRLLKQMLLYGLPVMVGGLAGMVNETFDRIALKHLVECPVSVSDCESYVMSNIGIYGACYKLSIVMSLFIQAFKFAAEPYFFSKMKNADAKQTYADVMSVYTLFLLTIFIGVMAYLDILQYFVGSEFRSGLKVVPVLLLANLCLGIYYNLSVWYKVSDKTIYGAYISGIGAVITLILNYLLVPHMGYMGAAWTTLICYFAIMVICWAFGQKFYPVKYPIKRLSLYTLLALVLVGAIICNPVANIVLKLLINTALLLVFVAVAYRFDVRKRLS